MSAKTIVFSEGPTPWTDARTYDIGDFFQQRVATDIRRLERRCRAAEALLQKARDSVVAKPLQQDIDAHLRAMEEMDR